MQLIIPYKRGKISKKVESFDQIEKDVVAMQEALENNNFNPPSKKNNVALHHSQVSTDPYNFFVVKRSVVGLTDKTMLVVFVNPRIVEKDKTTKLLVSQGCISFSLKNDIAVPVYGRVKVYYEIAAKGGKLKAKEEWFEGFMGEIFQHEIAHSHGVTIYDGRSAEQIKIDTVRLRKQIHKESKKIRQAQNEEIAKAKEKFESSDEGIAEKKVEAVAQPEPATFSAPRPPCKQCHLKPRQEASSRCKSCSITKYV